MVLSQVSQEQMHLYDEWKKEQIKKAEEFYQDEEGKIPEINKIAFYHTHFIGGSMDAAIMGLSKWRSVRDVYDQMFHFPAQLDKFVFTRGHFFEPFVATQFTKITHIPTVQGITLNGVEKGYPFSFAQIDFLCSPDNIPLEIKVATYNSDDELSRWGVGCKFNESGFLLEEDSQIPVDYMIQCQKQLWLSDNKYMYLAVWITLENKIRIYKIHRDDELIEEIISSEIDFLFNHVIPQIPYKDEDVYLLEEQGEDSVLAENNFIEDCKKIKEIAEQIKELENEKETIVKRLKKSMGDHKIAVDIAGNKIASNTEVVTTSFNKDKLAEQYPEIYKKFITKRLSRRFTIAKHK